MKILSVREAQRHLCTYLKAKEPFSVMMVDGTIWEMTVRHASNSQKLPILPAEILDYEEEVSDMHEEAIKCHKCNGIACYSGETWNAEGEWVAMDICENCFKKFKPAKFKQI